jgi:hypothetical protein
VQTVSDPQTHNAYGYVRNNPVNLTDPDGQSFGKLLSGLGLMAFFFGMCAGFNPFIMVGGLSMTAQGQAMEGNLAASIVFSVASLGVGGAAIALSGGKPFAGAPTLGVVAEGGPGILAQLAPLLVGATSVLTTISSADSVDPDPDVLTPAEQTASEQSQSGEGSDQRTRESYGNNMSGFDLVLLAYSAWSLIRLGYGLARGAIGRVLAPRAAPKPNPNVIREIQRLPDDAVLTPEQAAELGKNLDRVLGKTLPAKARSGRVQDVVDLLRNDPRFRFLDQIPGGRAKIEEALRKYGAPGP